MMVRTLLAVLLLALTALANAETKTETVTGVTSAITRLRVASPNAQTSILFKEDITMDKNKVKVEVEHTGRSVAIAMSPEANVNMLEILVDAAALTPTPTEEITEIKDATGPTPTDTTSTARPLLPSLALGLAPSAILLSRGTRAAAVGAAVIALGLVPLAYSQSGEVKVTITVPRNFKFLDMDAVLGAGASIKAPAHVYSSSCQVEGANTCPSCCLGRGECSSGGCKCDEGFKGENCAQSTSGAKNSDVWIVQVETGWPPFSYIDAANGRISGYSVDLAEAVCNAAGKKCEIIAGRGYDCFLNDQLGADPIQVCP